MDRREIFEKYVQEGSEHSSKILPYSNDDPELIGNRYAFRLSYKTKSDLTFDELINGNIYDNIDIKTDSARKQIFNGLPICSSKTSNVLDGIDQTCHISSDTNTSQNKNSPIQVRWIQI